jgi:hypothetical protein
MITGLIGIVFGIAAGACLLVGLIPLLGWLNWLTSLPLAIVGLAFSLVSARARIGSSLGVAGTVLCLGVIAVAVLRLVLGHGFF